MDVDKWETIKPAKGGRAAVLAVALLGVGSAAFWSMRGTLDMPPDLARAVVRDRASTEEQRRNAMFVVSTDVRQAIADLREHAREGNQFAKAALMQIRATADEALR